VILQSTSHQNLRCAIVDKSKIDIMKNGVCNCRR